MGRFVRCVDTVLDSIGRLGNNTFSEFEEVQNETEWLISFAMSVAKTFSHSQDEKDIVNGCNHLVNELGNLKEAMGSENLENLELAKAVAKDFAEVTEQSVNRYNEQKVIYVGTRNWTSKARLLHKLERGSSWGAGGGPEGGCKED